MHVVSAYGIKAKTTIAIIGGGDHSVTSKAKAAPERRTEEGTITQIQSELDNVRQKLKPDVDNFLTLLQPPSSEAQPPKEKSSKQVDLAQEHARLGELLLQSLLRLDGIVAEGEWEVARKERKGAVREVQGLLERLDSGWKARAKA